MEDDEKPNFKLSIEGFDPLGLKSAGEIAKETTKFGIDAAKAFLSLTCKPLLEEFGLMLKDPLRNWRLTNIIKTLEKANGKLTYDFEKDRVVIDPRVAFQIIEHASIIENNTLQDMWGGLFASSCQNYEEDENIFFIDILKRLTSSQVKLLNYLCEKSKKNISGSLPTCRDSGLVFPSTVKMSYQELLEVMETDSSLKVDTEFKTLEKIGLITHTGNDSLSWGLLEQIKSGSSNGPKPTLLAIRLFVKCKGSSETPYNFFLPQIKEHFSNILNGVIETGEKNVLDFVYDYGIEGLNYKDDVEFGSLGLKVKNEDWLRLNITDLNNKLRAYLIYRHISGIKQSWPLEIAGKKFGLFNYVSGVIKSEDSINTQLLD